VPQSPSMVPSSQHVPTLLALSPSGSQGWVLVDLPQTEHHPLAEVQTPGRGQPGQPVTTLKGQQVQPPCVELTQEGPEKGRDLP
jgi:hypothetical protein